jgi:hypothetical protein
VGHPGGARPVQHHRWGAKYFDINEAGHVVAMPLRENGAVVDLTDVIEEAKGRGLKFPVLIRFQDILRDRVEAINQAFAASIAEFNYQNKYRGVFPIKVNQLREVVEEILDAGKPYQFGLEVGSKPELFAGLALQKPARLPDYLQRLQGRAVHPHGADGHQAGQESHHGGGEAGGVEADHRRLAPDGGRAAGRHPRAAGQQRGGQMGRQRRGKRQVRAQHGRIAGGLRDVAGGKNGVIVSSCCISTSARRCRTF